MLASRQPITASVRRDAWVEIDLSAIEYNIAVIKSWLKPETKLMAVVKGDAYGHGALGIAEVLSESGADYFGVASIDEGCQLRARELNKPILLLSPCPTWALDTAIDSGLDLTLTGSEQVSDITKAALKLNKTARLHLKVDTGMHRLGVPPHSVLPILSQISKHAQLHLVGVYSHLAQSDDRETTERQNNTFREVLNLIRESPLKPDLIHLASGDATRLFPETHYDMVRPGLLLYGLGARTVLDMVIPAMSVRGRINHIQDIEAGEAVGYNLTWRSQRKSKIASIPIGYADGIDRGLSNRMSGLLLGCLIPQVGLISMDQMLFDITDVAQAQEGDVITLIGSDTDAEANTKQLYLADWAKTLDTITYELCCRLKTRLPRVYTRQMPPSDRSRTLPTTGVNS